MPKRQSKPPQPAQPVQATAATKPETQEIASIDRDYNRLFFGNTLTHDDDTLLTRGGSKSYRIYDDLERDAHCGAVLDKRKMAVTSRPWVIKPASEAPLDVAAADLVRLAFGKLRFNGVCKRMLDATLKGFSVGEVMWAVVDGMVLPVKVINRDQRRFTFNLQGQLRLKTKENMMDGIAVPERKFIVHTYGGKDGTPYGLGLGSKLFWPVFFKKQGIGFWLTFADKFGSPTALGKYPNGTLQPEQNKLLSALRAMSQDAGVIIPAGMEVELIEASRSGSVDTYEKLIRYMDEQISKAVLGETMSTTAASTGLGSNQAGVHNDVRIELAQDDNDDLCETLGSTLIAWLVFYNMPGAGLPTLEREFEEPEDLAQRATRDKTVGELGYEPTEEYILETYGEGWVKKAAPAAPPAGMFTRLGVDGQQPAFSESIDKLRRARRANQDVLELAADQLAGNWRKTMQRRVEDLQAMLEETGDLVMFRERMATLLETEPPKELVESIANANFAAQLLGRGPADAEFSEADSGWFKGLWNRLFNGAK
ncbi:DUF935 domain-containing protein [Polaromonas sp. JS666]|uniref:DUF935 domain-containing protein n=1 Tax=Polaromonas sp. (strain JS666 / ATCC BAA-500) TaxID=296591 RepID=UPI0000464B38|nr:DUF935 family protein [Polaromonas sp. JS666]ABE45682.1 protein of unknown function DUF935 [Polaromonas sp. JS666]